jgi:hypothetical protein
MQRRGSQRQAQSASITVRDREKGRSKKAERRPERPPDRPRKDRERKARSEAGTPRREKGDGGTSPPATPGAPPPPAGGPPPSVGGRVEAFLPCLRQSVGKLRSLAVARRAVMMLVSPPRLSRVSTVAAPSRARPRPRRRSLPSPTIGSGLHCMPERAFGRNPPRPPEKRAHASRPDVSALRLLRRDRAPRVRGSPPAAHPSGVRMALGLSV